MTTLALEFSTDRRSVAILRDETILSERIFEGSVRTPIFSLIEAALKEAAIGVREVDHVVVGLGPGSYTGVRLAISVVQGWQLGSAVRVAGVNSLETMASMLGSEPATLVVDAQRGECAVAECKDGQLTGPIRLVAVASLKEALARGERLVGPEVPELIGGEGRAFPTASAAARLGIRAGVYVPAEQLAPVYLREAAFVKAPPARDLG